MVTTPNGSVAPYYFRPGMTMTTFTPDQLIGGNLKVVTSSETYQKTDGLIIPRGAVMGRITATNKLVICQKTASDGSQTPCGICVDAVDVSADDAVGGLYVQAEINAGYVSADDSWASDTEALKVAFLNGPGNIILKDGLSNAII